MSSAERLQAERHFHDLQAEQRALTFAGYPERLQFTDKEYLDHETWLRPAMARFGPLSGKRALDLGCGHGMASVVLARRGAKVTAMDLSAGYLKEAAKRAIANETHIDFIQGNGEILPFADESFDCIWGNAVLHHLDLEQSGREILRVMAPYGIAVFCEPWNGNPLLRWARHRLPYSGKEHTPDEVPLGRQDVALLRRIFPRVRTEGFQLFSMLHRAVGLRRLCRILRICDSYLLQWLPFLQRFCRYMVLTLSR